jgi:hypothetical protein
VDDQQRNELPPDRNKTLALTLALSRSGDPAASSEAGQRVAHYRLIREIGRGSMSRVYEARDTRGANEGRLVALKLLADSPRHGGHCRTRWLCRPIRREARAIASLSHPNIVAIYEVGEHKGQHFIAMEYLPGKTLRAWLNEHGPLSPAETSRILDRIADALDAVHAQNLVHRAIKPGNVMILPGGGVTLLDFGLARQIEDSVLTHRGAILGSPAYLAPEQARGDAATPAADRWALGALVYEMLAGHAPFAGTTLASLLYQVTRESPAPLPSDLPPRVKKVVSRALDKDPARRFGSARALADAFRSAVARSNGRTAVAANKRRDPVLNRRAPRRAWAAGAAALGALVLAGSVASIMAEWRLRAAPGLRTSVTTPAIPAPLRPPDSVAVRPPDPTHVASRVASGVATNVARNVATDVSKNVGRRVALQTATHVASHIATTRTADQTAGKKAFKEPVLVVERSAARTARREATRAAAATTARATPAATAEETATKAASETTQPVAAPNLASGANAVADTAAARATTATARGEHDAPEARF